MFRSADVPLAQTEDERTGEEHDGDEETDETTDDEDTEVISNLSSFIKCSLYVGRRYSHG